MLDLISYIPPIPHHRPGHNIPYTLDWADVAICTTLCDAFYGSPFNRDSLLNWDTSRVTDMSFMFLGSQYNHPLITHICWDMENLIYAFCMFAGSQYNHPLITTIQWNLRKLRYAKDAFQDAPYTHAIPTAMQGLLN